jgi:hypothetical protein
MDKDISQSIYRHDVFNMVALSFVLLSDLEWLISSNLDSSIRPDMMLVVMGVYLFLDVVWISLDSKSVPGNRFAIIAHHVITLIYIYWPWYYPFFRLTCAALGWVEINTLAIIFRRNCIKGTFLYKICEYSFLITWVLFRLMLFPYILYLYIFEYLRHSDVSIEGVGTYFNDHLPVLVIQCFLCAMSLSWTIELITKLQKTKPKDT